MEANKIDQPRFLRAIKIGPGPAIDCERHQESIVMTLEDAQGQPYFTVFKTRNNYFEGVMKSFSRIQAVNFNASGNKASAPALPSDHEAKTK